MKLDILVLAAHPDDAELGCGGTIAKHIKMGKKVGVVDLTKGELGTRGSVEVREKEASEASKILGLTIRENLALPDGFFSNAPEYQKEIIKVVRKYQPEIVLANAIRDRHPDHGKAATLIYDACFLAGLIKIDSLDEQGVKQEPWRPKVVYHYIQSQFIEPDFIVDVSGVWDKKMEAIRAFKSQFFDPNSAEPQTYISSPNFMRMIEARGIELGHAMGVQYGEGFTVRNYIGVNSLFDLQ